MENEAPVTPDSNPNDLSKDTPVTGNVDTRSGDFISRDQNIAGDMITAEIGAGAQNVVVGSGNTQIIGYTAEQVAVIITQIRRDDQPQGWNGRIPYIGLDSFSEQQAHLFFGREQLVTHLLTRVQENRFLCITGPSGSGKSSLVQAGLIPALRAGQIAGSEQWLLETVRPGNQPLENLALAMGRLAKSPEAAEYFRHHGLTDPLTLHMQIETFLSHQLNQRAVIVIDQFEEIFTQTKDEALRLAFLVLLTQAVQRADGRVSVLLTMRSDFVSQCATYADLRQLISGHLELVGAMEPEELARAIAMPALEVGVEVKSELIAQVINDMHGEPGALPLMQFALKDLFDAQPKQPGKQVVLTLQEYLVRGGIQQALERYADAQFATFLPEEQGIARQIFMSLIEVGRETVDTRRTATFTELLRPGVDANQVERVIQTLANARLITTDNPQPERETPDVGDTRTVTIAHEKLIEAWPWLQQLVRENRTLIELQNQINEDASQWVEHKQDASYLYTGARLQTAQEQLAANQLTLSSLAQQLIDASIGAEDKRLQQIEDERQSELEHERALAQEQKLRAEEQTQAAAKLRQRNFYLRLMSIAAILIAGITVYFYTLAREQLARQDGLRWFREAEQFKAAGKVEEAMTVYTKAAKADASLKIDLAEQEKDVRRQAALLLIHAGENLARKGDLTHAAQKYHAALDLKPPLDTPVYVYVNAGEFKMGSTDEQVNFALDDCLQQQKADCQRWWFTPEEPQQEVHVGGFWIMRTELTNAQYGTCVKSGICAKPANRNWDNPQLSNWPVTDVTWSEAIAYAQWIGGRLPTEAEWEKACRGDDARLYPWGNDPPTSVLANFSFNTGTLTHVGSYEEGQSPYGLLDMAGNAWEWTNSKYLNYPYKADSAHEGQIDNAARTLRGGAMSDDSSAIRCAHRITQGPQFRLHIVGFRVVSPGF